MRIKTVLLLSCVLISISASACSPTVQTVEVTRIVPQTVVVTQLVQVPITMTPVPSGTPAPPIDIPVPTETPESARAIDLSRQDGSIVIVQYFTLLDLHLYEQAYNLFSYTKQLHSPKEKFLEGEKEFSKVVKVLKVIRYNDWIKQMGRRDPKVSDNWYYVQIYAEGEHEFAGAYPNGIQPDLFVRVTLENGEWKIEEFSTVPY